jgi:alkylation response protein AidB-like acyl-CoA dehydrogenase
VFSVDVFEFPDTVLPPGAEALRLEVRRFLQLELTNRPMEERARSWTGVDFEFTRKLGARGWIGMSLPKRYGGHERGMLERYVVVEELLAAGAPVAAYWAADRQVGPLILRFGTEEQKQSFLPRIATGECFFCLGMSEPGSGSDLAAVRTLAVPTTGGFLVNGSKIWTSGADRAHYMALFCRTDVHTEDRHGGFSQMIVDMTSPGVTVRPILEISGRRTFNQVFFENVFVPEQMLVGKQGQGWRQVTSELSLERSGPDRFLSSFVLLVELVRALGESANAKATEAVGRLIGHLHVLRRMSLSVASMIQQGKEPSLQASLVKDLGALFEQEIPEIARLLIDIESPDVNPEFRLALAHTTLISPAFSLRGGTREILRGMIARGLGLR